MWQKSSLSLRFSTIQKAVHSLPQKNGLQTLDWDVRYVNRSSFTASSGKVIQGNGLGTTSNYERGWELNANWGISQFELFTNSNLLRW